VSTRPRLEGGGGGGRGAAFPLISRGKGKRDSVLLLIPHSQLGEVLPPFAQRGEERINDWEKGGLTASFSKVRPSFLENTWTWRFLSSRKEEGEKGESFGEERNKPYIAYLSGKRGTKEKVRQVLGCAF